MPLGFFGMRFGFVGVVACGRLLFGYYCFAFFMLVSRGLLCEVGWACCVLVFGVVS